MIRSSFIEAKKADMVNKTIFGKIFRRNGVFFNINIGDAVINAGRLRTVDDQKIVAITAWRL